MRQHYFFRKWLVAMLFALLLPVALFARAPLPKAYPQRLVTDSAHVLSADEDRVLEKKLEDFSNATSNQVAIITILSTNGDDIGDFATKQFNFWGIGTGKNNNGVLIVAAIQDRKLFIPVGRGLQGALPDITTRHIIGEQIAPAFRESNYYQGLDRGVDAIIAATKGEYEGAGTQQGMRGISGSQIIALVVIIFIIISFIRRGGGGGGSFMSRRGSSGFGGGFFTGSILGSMLGGGGGGGGWGGGDSGGGGFGGFGGGSTDGGGAGGSW